MIADFIGGPWHLETKPLNSIAKPLKNSAGHWKAVPWIYVPILGPPPTEQCIMDEHTTKISFDACHYRLAFETSTFCVYVDNAAAVPWKDPTMVDPVRYFFAREHRFAEEVKGWTHHNAEFAAASVEGLRGMLAIQRFRKRR